MLKKAYFSNRTLIFSLVISTSAVDEIQYFINGFIHECVNVTFKLLSFKQRFLLLSVCCIISKYMCCCFDAIHVSWEDLDEKYYDLLGVFFYPCEVLCLAFWYSKCYAQRGLQGIRENGWGVSQ